MQKVAIYCIRNAYASGGAMEAVRIARNWERLTGISFPQLLAVALM